MFAVTQCPQSKQLDKHSRGASLQSQFVKAHQPSEWRSVTVGIVKLAKCDLCNHISYMSKQNNLEVIFSEVYYLKGV